MASINKSELAKEVAAKSDLKASEAEEVIDIVTSSIQADLAKGEKVQVIGFGSFEVRQRAQRKGRNPQTGETLTIPATHVPAFKPGKVLKDAIK
ncbi:HU family DNA-binding protein [Lactobacillus sp. ESL0684]|uniref:HU family DNA-binding protein n=1 Tax=unclassified Lactobacillus TaxID=2620435 RepID=UPI0023F724B5|nr:MULTISPECIES: HU family DNA-binding protein [unclassified Lactobacillus]WEV40773.1 HU family DNA-binding protein [Lactobacillus sp. ESL0681]WEV44399.1 HU family DNA-binding protein [Lactobacillus sp. ESL0684]